VAAGSLPVVVGACAGRSQQRVERLGHEGVDESVVMDETGQGDFLLAGCADESVGDVGVISSSGRRARLRGLLSPRRPR
jgi:hypothetical protein